MRASRRFPTAYGLLMAHHARAAVKSTALSLKRGELPPGTSRARITTANARWMRAAEERDRLAKELRDMEEMCVSEASRR